MAWPGPHLARGGPGQHTLLLCLEVNLVKASNVRPHAGTKIAKSIISPDLIAHESFLNINIQKTALCIIPQALFAFNAVAADLLRKAKIAKYSGCCRLQSVLFLKLEFIFLI